MGKIKDITGQQFGGLVAMEPANERCDGRAVWLCRCDCGGKKVIDVISPLLVLISGNTCSCGCLKVDVGKVSMDANIGRVEGTQLSRLQKRGFGSSSTGVGGVSFRKGTGMYVARITLKRNTVYLGSFPTLEEAAKARVVAETELFDPILEKYGMKREE